MCCAVCRVVLDIMFLCMNCYRVHIPYHILRIHIITPLDFSLAEPLNSPLSYEHLPPPSPPPRHAAVFSCINNAHISPSFITKYQTSSHNGSLHSPFMHSPLSLLTSTSTSTGQPRVHRLRLPYPRRRKGRLPRHRLRPATRCRRRQARRREGRYQARAGRGALYG